MTDWQIYLDNGRLTFIAAENYRREPVLELAASGKTTRTSRDECVRSSVVGNRVSRLPKANLSGPEGPCVDLANEAGGTAQATTAGYYSKIYGPGRLGEGGAGKI